MHFFLYPSILLNTLTHRRTVGKSRFSILPIKHINMHTWRRKEATHEPYNCQPDPEPQPPQKRHENTFRFLIGFFTFINMWWVCSILTSIIFDDSIACTKQNIFVLLAPLWPTSAHQKWPTKPIWQRRLEKFKELHVSYFNKRGRKRYSISCLKQFGLQCDENSNSLMWFGAFKILLWLPI